MDRHNWRSLLRPILVRLLQALLVALIVGALGFALMAALPGDQAFRLAAARYGPDMGDATAAALVREELGLDRPRAVQFLDWIGQLLRLDLGHSLVTGEPVLEELRGQLGHTLSLAAVALPLSAILGLPLGILSGLHPSGLADRVTLGLSVLLRAVPAYALGLLLVAVFSIRLGWLPPAGFEGWREFILPGLTLALGLAALSARVTRDSVAAVSTAPYMAFARWKGLPERAAVLRHGLRNAAIPVVALLGFQLIGLIEGLIIVESLFSWPGIGHALVHAIFARDVPVVQGAALLMGLLFVLVNALVDLACATIDPRRARAGA
ncbi:ABC transporter permease [Muricoccus aerilatus]|uniref:ABC transporter permease n=1 Tax=Muricoccus aerilatus TaxID=452982 RepID=UPI0006944066|nr:ABC transporter permease [Roseomonas aerilata]